MYDFSDETMHLEFSTAYSYSLHHPDIRKKKYLYENTAQQSRFLVVRINEHFFRPTSSLQFLQLISYIIMPGSISIPNAKFFLLALYVHDSYFKMLAKKIFLSTNLIKLKPRFPNDQSVSICVQRITRSKKSRPLSRVLPAFG